MRSARIPRPLLALLVVVAFTGASWALVLPAYQVTDEDSHFSYVHTLAEHGRLPGGEGEEFAEELYATMDVLNSKAAGFFLDPGARPEWAPQAYEEWRELSRQLNRHDGGGPNSASGYPPAYYASLVPGYLVAHEGDAFTRLIATRLTSVLWLLVSTIGAWLLAGEMLGRRRVLQLVCAATVGMWPMLTYVSAGVNPDAMQSAVWTWTFWAGVRVLRRGLTPKDGALFGGLVGLALLTKATSLAILPAAGFLALVAVWRMLRSDGLRRAAMAAAPLVAAFAVPVLIWIVVTASIDRPAYGQASLITGDVGTARPFQIREFASYVWQFYFPKLWFMQDFELVLEAISNRGAHNIWFGHMFGVFGWTNIWFPLWVYDIFLAAFATVVVGALAGALNAVRRDSGLRATAVRAAPYAGFFAVAILGVLVGLHITEYRQWLANQGPFMQGRYLLPLIGLLGLLVASAVAAVSLRWQRVAAGAWLGGLVAYQMAALSLNLTRFYA